ncbi:MAG: GAF domain-containing protein, partial [Chloroflexota bacterium]|nr:GAF domain-containing protein [Chloroflexota bacterium]
MPPAQPANRPMQANPDLKKIYDSIYRGVSALLECDAFFIVLCGEADQTGDFVFRIERGIPLPPERVALADGLVNYVTHHRRAVVVPDASRETRFRIRHWGGPHAARSLVCVPMLYDDQVIGALSAQSYRQDAFAEANLKVLSAFADQAALTIHNARLFAESQRKAEQLAVLNEVARIVSSTIELNRLFDLIYHQVQRILPADTYYVGVVDAQREIVSLEMLVDEGKRFPRSEVPLGNTLVGYVLRRKTPLLLRSISAEAPALGIQPGQIGKPQPAESWLGVPLMVSDGLLGVLVVASYERGAFDDSDQEILQSLATHVAIAIDNARHHAQVEEQARRDSLTQVLNHGYFLTRLREEVQAVLAAQTALSLIMLDIDHFKEYNDSLGHVSGDAVLRGTVQAIRINIKQGDLVGRWGGEEFVIGLLQCDQPNARQVAERIRRTLAEM